MAGRRTTESTSAAVGIELGVDVVEHRGLDMKIRINVRNFEIKLCLETRAAIACLDNLLLKILLLN